MTCPGAHSESMAELGLEIRYPVSLLYQDSSTKGQALSTLQCNASSPPGSYCGNLGSGS